MNKNKQIFELYIDYLVTSFSYTTATGLSDLLDGDIIMIKSRASSLTNSSALLICGRT